MLSVCWREPRGKWENSVFNTVGTVRDWMLGVRPTGRCKEIGCRGDNDRRRINAVNRILGRMIALDSVSLCWVFIRVVVDPVW